MVLMERTLVRVVSAQSLDCCYLCSVGLHGEDGARLNRIIIEKNRTRTTRRGITTNVGTL